MKQIQADELRKRSFVLPSDLEQRLLQERERFAKEHGIAVSLNQVAVKAMRDGLKLPPN